MRSTVSVDLEAVQQDLKDVGGDKQRLIHDYQEEMLEIQGFYGGQYSDIPPDPTNKYWVLQAKLNMLVRMK